MAFIIKDRVKEGTTTAGTGAFTLGGAVATFEPFNSYMSNGDTTYYAVVHTTSGVDEWEVGLGTWNTGNTLTRTTVLSGSNGTSAVDFSSGTKDVFMTYPAAHAALAEDDVTFANITVTGTVDGRDVAADGTKLDTVEQNADVTDAVNIAAAGALMRAGGTMTGNLVLNADPAAALGAATKQYVDTIAAAGIHYHAPVRVEAPLNLTVTYNNGTNGVGATLTNAGTQEAITIDGVALSSADRVLVYQQTDATQNGIYTVTTVGDGSTNWVLTRATDADSYGVSDPDAFGEGDAFFVKEGATGAGELYVMNTSGTITFGTTAITFTLIAETAVYSAGTGITLTGTAFSIGQDVGTTDNVTFNQVTAAIIGNVTGDVTGNVTGNAGTATKLATARTVQLSGDVTGSATFDGSANINITAAVQDDSHSHVISNVDGLQTALDDKADDSTTLTAGNGLTGGGTLGANRTFTVGAGGGITVTADAVAHSDTSTQASLTALTGADVVSDIDLDTYGHVTNLATRTMTLANLGYTGATDANNYTHPTHPGDDAAIDTGALTGATVISDLDLNITTDTLGHVTDANATVATRTMTLADLGYTGATNANNSTSNATHTGEVTGSGALTVADNVIDAGNLKVTGNGSSTQFLRSDGDGTFTWATPTDTVYTHPTFNGDDFSVDTGALTGATVVSDIDINVTTDTNGHVTDANGTVATRTLTLADLGYTGATNATANVGDITGVTAGAGITGGGTSGTVTLSHADTSSQASVDNSGRTYIQDITLDTYGHITGITSATETVVNTDTNTTYTAGTGMSLSGTTFNCTVVNTDTNTTYSADGNYGMTLSGTTFRLEDDRRRNSTTTDIYSGNTHDYTFYDASHGIRWYTAGAEEMRLEDDGDLHVDGNIVAYSTTVSDERLKTDIVKIDGALDKVDQINGYTFTYTTDGKKSAGVIAQEVEKVLPSAITESKLPLKMGEDDDTEYKTVQYDQLIGLLVEAVKELKAEVAELRGK